MGLSTHVLDTMNGCPAAGMRVRLYALDAPAPTLLADTPLNADGRNANGPLIASEAMRAGRFRLVFSVADYFRARGVALPEPAFLDEVTLDFGVADVKSHYHVPLLCSPWSHSTYRGS